VKLTFEHSIDSATAFRTTQGQDFYGNTYRFEAVADGPLENGHVAGSAGARQALIDAASAFGQKDLAAVFADPSCLNLAIAVAKKLAAVLPAFHSLRVWEGKHRWVEVSREEALAAADPAPAE
jgi:hypothetical protein